MIVYKFGGASVKDAEGVRNIGNIVSAVKEDLIIVVSAMGKTTNAMEEIVRAYFNGEKNVCKQKADEVVSKHFNLAEELFGRETECRQTLEKWFEKLKNKLSEPPSLNFDFEYDQVVFYGEMFSTTIVSCYLKSVGTDNRWLDIRQVLKTNEQYREAETDWGLSAELMKKAVDFSKSSVYVTQGFIGGTINNLTTTLGREGSDYTSAVLGYVFGADRVAIWKDVPGILNADPRWYPDTVKIDEISYREAIELAFYGAQVIHPKTIKPLENKRIPLLVKSFVEPEAKGTRIHKIDRHVTLPPVYILKKDQILLTISPKDFSFIVENNLSEIFNVFDRRRVKVNMMHNSAINFSVCMNYVDDLDGLLKELSENYAVKYNDDLELVTIRHYTDPAVRKVLEGKDIIDSQVSRSTARYVVRRSDWNF
jgi:aspartate kinase